MKRIPLTQGKFALVDDEDFEKLKRFNWFYHRQKKQTDPIDYGRAARSCNCPLVKQYPTIYLHRQIMETPKRLCVDHINHDTLDNRKRNLRNCSASQNLMNQNKCRQKTASEYKGVHWEKGKKLWRTRLYDKAQNKYLHLGYFHSETEAAKAYDKKAKELFGEFAKLNVFEERREE